MTDNINIKKEVDYHNGTFSTNSIGNNNLKINLNENDNKRILINNNIKPMLNNSSGNSRIKIKTKKIPIDTFGMLANQRSESSDNEKSDSESDESIISFDQQETNKMSDEINFDNDNDNDNDNEYEDDNDNLSEVSGDDDGTVHSKNSSAPSEGSETSDYTKDSSDSTEKEYKKPKTYEEVLRDKQILLFKLERLQKQGYPSSKKYTMASQWEDMNFEFERLKKQRDVEKSIKMSRKILLAIVSGIEYVNDRFDPLDVKLNGWSENLLENINDYDEVFEELHDKYNTSLNMAPELKLLAMVAGSGFMFHLTNSLFKSATPDLNDILRQNPDIMKNITEAAARNMNSNIQSKMGGSDDPIGNLMMNGINNANSRFNPAQAQPPMQTQSQSQSQVQNRPTMNSMPVNFPMRPPTFQQTPMTKIPTPSPISNNSNESELDNLLNELNGINSPNKGGKRAKKSGGLELSI